MVAALSVVPQVYVDIQASPALVPGLTADTVACTGLASRGPVNRPQYTKSLDDFVRLFGPETPSVADGTQPLSLWKGAYAMDSQGVTNKLFNRVGGATLAAGYIHISNGSGKMIALHAATPGTWGNNLSVVVGAGTSAATFTLTVTNSASGETDTLTNLAWADNAALITKINQTALLVVASQPVVDAPQAAPATTISTGSGTLPAASYYGIMTYTNAAGETVGSPESAIATLASPGNIIWTAASLPSGATGTKLYMGTAKGAEVYAGANASGVAITVSAAPAASTLTPPTRSTALTGAGNTASIATAGTFAFPTVRGTGQGIGDNGENCPAANFIGASGTPSTGLYSFAALDPKPRLVFVAEQSVSSDVTTWATQAQIAADSNWIAVVALDKAMTYDTAITTLTTSPVTTLKATAQAAHIKVAYGGLNVDDSYYAQTLSYGAAGFFASVTAAQDANTSAGLKALANVDSALYDLMTAQAEQLVTAGANPLISTKGVGLCFARDLCLDGTEGFKARLDSLLVDAFGLIGVGYLQKPSSSARRRALQDEVMQYLDGLAADGLIPTNGPAPTATTTTPTTSGTASKTGPVPTTVSTGTVTQRNYQAICDDTNNTQNGAALPQLICDVQVTYFNNPVAVRFRLTTGTNIQVTLQAA